MRIEELRHRIDEDLLDFGGFAIHCLSELAFVAATDLCPRFVEGVFIKVGILQQSAQLLGIEFWFVYRFRSVFKTRF